MEARIGLKADAGLLLLRYTGWYGGRVDLPYATEVYLVGIDRDMQAGISLRDVQVVAAEIGREWSGDVLFQLVLPMRANSSVTFHVSAEFTPRSIGRRSTRRQCRVSRNWPSGECRTLAGLLFRLVHDLGRELELQRPEVGESEQSRFA